MPRYAKGRGGAKRIWEIELDGAAYIVRYGKPDAPEEMRRTFASAIEARRAAERFIADRVKDGYVEVDADPLLPEPAATPRSREPALEAAIRAAPDDRDAYLVYADWLQQHDDPHGQLIALQAASADTSAHVRAHARALLGELASSIEHDAVRIDWRWGFVDRVRIEADAGRRRDAIHLLAELLELPISLVLRALSIGRPHDDEFAYAEVIEGLVHLAPRLAPNLRELVLGDFVFPDETELSWVTIGDVSPLYAAYPGLESLTLQGGELGLGTIAHEALRSFEVRTGGLSDTDVQAIVAARWPRLARLVVWFGDESYGARGTADDVRALLAGAPPGLVELGLCNAAFTDDAVDHLAAWPRLGALRTLDLSKGTLTDAGAARLAALADRTTSLVRLDVSENLLGAEGVERLAGLCREVITDNQRSPDERYPAVGE